MDPAGPTAITEFLIATLPISPKLLSRRPSRACACAAKNAAATAMHRSRWTSLLVITVEEIILSTIKNKCSGGKVRRSGGIASSFRRMRRPRLLPAPRCLAARCGRGETVPSDADGTICCLACPMARLRGYSYRPEEGSRGRRQRSIGTASAEQEPGEDGRAGETFIFIQPGQFAEDEKTARRVQ